MALTLRVDVDGVASGEHPLAFSNAHECSVRFPAGTAALDAQSSTVRCVIFDATMAPLVDVTAVLGAKDDSWVRMPGSRPLSCCTLDERGFTVSIDVRADTFLPAVLTAVRVMHRPGQTEAAASPPLAVEPPRKKAKH